MRKVIYLYTKLAPKKHTIILCTGNKNKLKEFIQIMGDQFHIDSEPVDLPELQGPPLQIAKEKALLAYEKMGKACVTEDTSLCFNALNGMPGPYVKWFLDAAGPEGLSKMLDGFEDKTGYAQCILSYMGPELKEPLQFVGQTQGVIVRPRGPRNFGWDPIFQPDGYTDTYAEMDKDVKNKISHRLKAIQKFIDHFLVN
ncbi:unnamed protein product (macronuclear) [Paramecium tetraurelia]|uniref:Inosine triphosphate pyrophosphatase n=1 Tax=Paramecium tetraurelia TaxID=5888 RepID=A0BPH3_PARTE|nr:uncharacterized protein GSPATT00005189001 [Paramecium tetraurelia]CAK60440.1 unnamed protein product [Paramecium tetraurelia]|eukprot:XP_001427838.1 hypothetical protein (macronuclear) [Paramecium tetraurelia strain d4-2]